MRNLLRYISILSIFIVANSLYSQTPADLVYPTDSTSCIPNIVELDWDPSPGNVTYSLLVSKNADLTNPIVDTNDIQSNTTLYNFFAPEENTKYYWSVTSHYLTNPPVQAYSDTFEFKTTRYPLAVNSPSDGALCLPTTVSFTLEDKAIALSYVIEVSQDPDFVTSEYYSDTLSNPSFSVDLSKYDVTYYYRAAYRYVDGSNTCQSDWSAVRSFETRFAPPGFLAPADSAIGVSKNTTVEWDQVPNILDYTIQVDDDSDFSSPLVDETTFNLKQDIVLPDSNTRYFYRLRSSDGSCESDWSEIRTFLTAYPQTAFLFPEDTMECIMIRDTFYWNSVPDAAAYTIQISRDEEFNSIDLEIKDITDTLAEVTSPNSLTQYYLRVRAEDSENIGPWSELISYTTTSFAPILKTPTDNKDTILLNTTLTWESLDPVTTYSLQVATDMSFDSGSIVFEDLSTNIPEQQLALTQYNTAYYWRVSSIYGECESGWSDPFTFTTVRGWPDLLSPADAATNISTSPLVEWNEVPGAEFYDLELAETSDFTGTSLIQRYSLNSFANVFPNLKENTKYYWRVRSKNELAISDWSPTNSFTTGVKDPNVVVLLQPSAGESQVAVESVDFVWSAAENAVSYDFQLSLSPSFETTVVSDTGLQDTTYMVENLENFKDYFWRVRSSNGTATSPWSATGRFETIKLAPTTIPTLISPTDGQENVSVVAHRFRWSRVPNADRYHFQVSTSMEFESADIVHESTSLIDTSFSVFSLDTMTKYYWRARAFNTGGTTEWSDPFSFTTFDPVSVGIDLTSEFVLSPNPIEGVARLSYTQKVSDISSIIIMDASGRFIELSGYSQTASSIELDFSRYGLSIGSYYLVVQGPGYNATIPFKVSSK